VINITLFQTAVAECEYRCLKTENGREVSTVPYNQVVLYTPDRRSLSNQSHISLPGAGINGCCAPWKNALWFCYSPGLPEQRQHSGAWSPRSSA